MARAKQSRVPVPKTYKLYVDGKFPRSESGRYYSLKRGKAPLLANVCRGSRKDFRDAVVAARNAFGTWSKASAYLRGQILYRAAEMLEGRAEQFTAELVLQGVAKARDGFVETVVRHHRRQHGAHPNLRVGFGHGVHAVDAWRGEFVVKVVSRGAAFQDHLRGPDLRGQLLVLERSAAGDPGAGCQKEL